MRIHIAACACGGRKCRAYHRASMLKRSLITVCALLALAGAPVRAAPADSAARFETDLTRLSEILGALHYLREICGANEGQKWREQMQALVAAEGQVADRKAKFTASFNRGYRGFQQTYRTCTPAADLAIRRYLEEGAKISREVTARYTN